MAMVTSTFILKNGLKVGSTLASTNSLNGLVSSDLTFKNHLTTKVSGGIFTFKSNLSQNAEITSTITFVNRLTNATGGVNYGEYEYDSNWGMP